MVSVDVCVLKRTRILIKPFYCHASLELLRCNKREQLKWSMKSK